MPIQGNFSTTIREIVTDLVTADKMRIENAIYKSTFTVSDFVRYHTLVTGVRDGSAVPVILPGNDFGSMPGGDEKSCDFNQCDVDINYSTKTWDLGYYDCEIPICLSNLDEDFLIFWNMYRPKMENPMDVPDASVLLDYIVGKVENRIKGTQWRVGYLGDSASANSLINKNNGYFVQAEAGTGTKINLPQASPTPEQIYEALQEAYNTASGSLWFSETDVIWKMTYAMAAKFVAFLNTKADLSMYNCDCINPDALVSTRRFTIEGLRIFGIPVEVHREIDLSKAAVSQTDVFQALLIRKSNMLIGTNTQDKLEKFRIVYVEREDMIYIQTAIYLGVSIPLDDEYVYITNDITP